MGDRPNARQRAKNLMRIMTFFQTLRGKLILTYTSVTVLALLALEITVLFFVVALSRGMNTETYEYLSDVVYVLAPQARMHLQPGARDTAELQDWLQATYDSGYASLPPQGLLDSPAAPIVKSDPMYVLSPNGIVLAAAPDSAASLVGRRYSPPANVSRGSEILNNAMEMNLNAHDLSAVRPDGSFLMAVPVRQQVGEGPLEAVIILTVEAPPPGIGYWGPVLAGAVLITGFVLLLAVAPFGALFGFIMSRGITHRLKALTLAADAWSEGDFTVQPQDRSKDEISYLGLRMRRMAEHIQTLLHTQHELALMEERTRLARELHDTVKQENFATLMQVRAARNLLERDPQAAGKHLEDAEALLKTSQQELGLLITELRPTALEGRGLAGALEDYLATWSQHARIPADLQVQNEQRLPLEVEQTLFRVAQEALSNAARHSRASAVTVRLSFEPGEVTLSITDNGVGFDPSNGSSGFGLQSMQERMAAIHGWLDVQSAPDSGATITASAPSILSE
jgi:two-component system, NarL family, sensor histidine kinase LiaS